MGLMLSIIVSCVGVLELFAFYTNVRRAVTAGEAHPTNASDLSCITESYIRDLNRERNKLLEEIRRLENSKEIAVGSTDRRRHEEHVPINTNSDLAPIKEKHVSRIFPTYTESHPIVVTDASEVSIISEPSTFHRESSPFPTYDRIAPRHSICSELVENPVVSVHEIDEEDYRSRTSSAMLSEEYFKSNFDSPQYWRRRSHSRSHSRSRSRTPEIHDEDLGNKEYLSRSLTTSSKDLLLNVPNLKSSKCTEETKTVEHISVATEFVEQTRLRRSESPFQKIVELQPSSESEVTVVEPEEDNKDELDKNVLNSVDGLKTKQIEEHRRQFKNKKKGKKNEVVERTQEVAGPSSSGSNPEPFWLIFSGEYTKAMNKDWHGQHFCCWQCDESLTGQRYVLRDEHPYCVSCYESVFANGCEKCNKIIGIDSKDLSYKDKHWHEACFLCTACGESLVDKQFGSRSDRIYCGKCYDEKFASRCDGCGEIFRAGTKKMEYKTRQWHEKCFCCVMCKTPIGTQSFIPREQEIYCAKCYEEKYATRCIKCNKVITSGGVTYKNEPWHRECFTCTNCQTSLAGARFTSRDDKPYCADCFGELFAKRCYACSRPITGIGGTKFISFEDRHWHNDCFYCASCRTSLVGKGFITDNTDIICPECAKQKLN